MKVYRDLKITGTQDALQQLIHKIEKNLDGTWLRDKQKEAQLNPLSSDNSYMYCYTCSDTQKRRASGLYLVAKLSEQYLYVSNIVPQNVGELSYDEYSHILEDFFQSVIAPATKSIDVEVTLSKLEHKLEDYMTPATAQLLRIFSIAANKSSAASHPFDEERWFAFIIAIHKEKSHLDGTALRRLLIEEGWSEEVAVKLISNYDNARSLLNYYDQSGN